MGATTLVSLEEYLRTTYRPDRDFLEGELLERNMGEQPHASVQGYLFFIFRQNREAWNVRPLPEQRTQVKERRFRIPDVAVLRGADPRDRIVRKAPLLCIEVMSSDDSLRDMRLRADDYAAMGVEHIWVVDPWKRVGYFATETGFEQPQDGVLRIPGTPIQVPLVDVFAELDD